MPTYGSPRKVEIVLTDDDGSERRAVATRRFGHATQASWDMQLQHPAQGWPASFTGNAVLDALGALIERKEGDYHQSKARGHRAPQMLGDRNIPIDDAGNALRANITTHSGKQVAFGRAAAAAARERNGG